MQQSKAHTARQHHLRIAVRAAATVFGIAMMQAIAAPVQTADSNATPAAHATHNASSALRVGPGVRNRIAGHTEQAYRLDVPAGHVVQGEFLGLGLTLDLQDADGRHVRRLSVADTSTQNFMWVASASPQRLVVRAESDTPRQFELRLTRTLTPAATITPSTTTNLESPRLRVLQEALADGRDTSAFWNEQSVHGTPLVEPVTATESLVTFLWRGQNKNVRLFGSPSGNHDPLTRLGNSDVWYASFVMPNTARLSYRLAPDVPSVQGSSMDQRRVILATAQRDPLNPHIYPATDASAVDVFQGSSVLELAQAPKQPWVRPRNDISYGSFKYHRYTSKLLNNERDIWIYRPRGAAAQALLIVFDAHAYLKQVPTSTIVDNLVADKLIPPTTIVLLGNPSPQARGQELPPNAAFATMLDKELMPWIKAQGLIQPADRTVIAGSSYGGLASAYAGLVNSHWFGNVLSLSGSYWWAPDGVMPGWMMREYAAADKRPLRFYIDAGRYEAARGGRYGILETSRHLGNVLRAKGYTVTQVEHDTGHDYLHWQGSLGCGLVALLNPARYSQGLRACEGSAPPS